MITPETTKKMLEALDEIRKLKPVPIGDTGFSVGPASLLRRAQEIALMAARAARRDIHAAIKQAEEELND